MLCLDWRRAKEGEGEPRLDLIEVDPPLFLSSLIPRLTDSQCTRADD